MTDRVEKLLDMTKVERYPICVEKLRVTTRIFKETEGEPNVMRRAKSQAALLREAPIFIQPGELIVGNPASKPMGVEIYSWVEPWPENEIRGLKDVGFDFTEEEVQEVLELNKYWKGRNKRDRLITLFDDERQWPFAFSGVLYPPWKSKTEWFGGYATAGYQLGWGPNLVTPYSEQFISEGLAKHIKDYKEELSKTTIFNDGDYQKRDFLNSVIISSEALIDFAHRFSELAAQMASEEKDPIRKKELELISSTCAWVPEHPARNFYEALQSYWFFYLCRISEVTSMGRMDQILYPYYKRDIEKGLINDEEVIELLQLLRVHDMACFGTFGKGWRDKHTGHARWHNAVLGGVDENGKDATNELSYLFIEAAKRCPCPHHTLTIRVHEGTPEKLMLAGLELVSSGVGMPAFVSDKSYMEFLMNMGVSLKDARNYCLAGCLDVAIPGKSRADSILMYITPLVFDFFMHEGTVTLTGKKLGPAVKPMTEYKTYEELLEAWNEYNAYFIGLQSEFNNLFMITAREQFADPLFSSYLDEALKVGRDMYDRKMPFENACSVSVVGAVNVADSLEVIRKLVFEEKKVTMEELMKALEANWEGYEDLHKMCMDCPKFGNDIDEVDAIAADQYKFMADTIHSIPTIYGSIQMASGISISAQWPGGSITGATPDGRFAGEVLADGTMSPMRGRDKNGPLAVFNSALKIDQSQYMSTLMNMKFHPTALKTESDLRKLSHMVRAYLTNGGKHVQFNVVNKEKLVDAMEHPENYKDLVVRVAGYSAYFVELSKPMQEEVTMRTTNML